MKQAPQLEPRLEPRHFRHVGQLGRALRLHYNDFKITTGISHSGTEDDWDTPISVTFTQDAIRFWFHGCARVSPERDAPLCSISEQLFALPRGDDSVDHLAHQLEAAGREGYSLFYRQGEAAFLRPYGYAELDACWPEYEAGGHTIREAQEPPISAVPIFEYRISFVRLLLDLFFDLEHETGVFPDSVTQVVGLLDRHPVVKAIRSKAEYYLARYELYQRWNYQEHRFRVPVPRHLIKRFGTAESRWLGSCTSEAFTPPSRGGAWFFDLEYEVGHIALPDIALSPALCPHPATDPDDGPRARAFESRVDWVQTQSFLNALVFENEVAVCDSVRVVIGKISGWFRQPPAVRTRVLRLFRHRLSSLPGAQKRAATQLPQRALSAGKGIAELARSRLRRRRFSFRRLSPDRMRRAPDSVSHREAAMAHRASISTRAGTWFFRRYNLDAAIWCIATSPSPGLRFAGLSSFIRWSPLGRSRSTRIWSVFATLSLLPYLIGLAMILWLSDLSSDGIQRAVAFGLTVAVIAVAGGVVHRHRKSSATDASPPQGDASQQRRPGEYKRAASLTAAAWVPATPLASSVLAAAWTGFVLIVFAELGWTTPRPPLLEYLPFRGTPLAILLVFLGIIAVVGVLVVAASVVIRAVSASNRQSVSKILQTVRLFLPRVLFALTAAWMVLSGSDELARNALYSTGPSLVVAIVVLIPVTFMFAVVEVNNVIGNPIVAALRASLLLAFATGASIVIGVISSNLILKTMIVNSEVLDQSVAIARLQSLVGDEELPTIGELGLREGSTAYEGLTARQRSLIERHAADEQHEVYMLDPVVVTEKLGPSHPLSQELSNPRSRTKWWSASELLVWQLTDIRWSLAPRSWSEGLASPWAGSNLAYVVTFDRWGIRATAFVFPAALLRLALVAVFSAIFLQLIFEEKAITEPL